MTKFSAATAFVAVFALHTLYMLFVRDPGCGRLATLTAYVAEGDVFLGFSYALGAAFTVWSLGRFMAYRSISAATGAAGGTVFVAGLAGIACFFSGCCGSPMLVVYASLFGVNSLALPKWTIALLSVVVISAGWWWQTRRACSR